MNSILQQIVIYNIVDITKKKPDDITLSAVMNIKVKLN